MALKWECAGCKHLKDGWLCKLHGLSILDVKYCGKFESDDRDKK